MTYNCDSCTYDMDGVVVCEATVELRRLLEEWIMAEIIAGRHWTLKCGLNERIRNADYRKGNSDNIKD